ncbi:hypothetical protein ART_0408 [Arthrobacter sp. PAMC 25486]|nr:hypothetical protein ART_0408 [Arthrobacter sp. PAMC 25486]
MGAHCKPCGIAGNRDQVAAVNIAKRVITGQTTLKVDRLTGRKRIKTAIRTPGKRAPPDKNALTPKRTRHKRVKSSAAATMTTVKTVTN